jgi:hypothetical protein
MEAEHKCLVEMHADLLNRELTVSFQERNLTSKAKELADKEEQLAKKKLQELATACRKLEEL